MKPNPFNFTIEFQRDILRFIVSARDKGVPHLDKISPNLFDDSDLRIVAECLRAYRKTYNTIPGSYVNLWQFFLNESSKSQISPDTKKTVERVVYEVFTPYVGDTPIMIESITKFAKFKGVTKTLDEYGPRIYEGVEVFDEMVGKLQKAISIGADDELSKRNQGTFLIRDREKAAETAQALGDGAPTFIHGLNKMRTTGGFMAPEITVIMSGPKFFKTGLIMNLIKYYLAQGKNIYWADTENGVRQLQTRLKQCILEATYQEIKRDAYQQELKTILDTAYEFGGDFINDFYTSDDNCDSIDKRLRELRDEYNWTPDIIVIDDPDKLKANDRKINDPRVRIKTVYTDMLALNNKWNCFSFVPSQVGRNAISKKIIKVKDLAEDISKSHTAHCLLALCRTELDLEDGLARLVVVLQRDGNPYREGSEIALKIDGSRMMVKEVDPATALEMQARWMDKGDESKKVATIYD